MKKLIYIALIFTAAFIFGYLMKRSGVEERVSEEQATTNNTRSAQRSNENQFMGRTRAELEAQYDKVFADLLARYPGLEPEWKKIPDEENGFLQLMQLIERLPIELINADGRLSFGSELNDTGYYTGYYTGGEWDLDKAADLFIKYDDLVKELTEIGELKQQSCFGLMGDKRLVGFGNVSKVRQCCELLNASARFAAQQGDLDTATRRLVSSYGLSKHLTGVEAPSIINNTAAVVSQLSSLIVMNEYILPSMSKPEDLDVLIEGFNPSELKLNKEKLFLGEPIVVLRSIAIPMWFNSNNRRHYISNEADRNKLLNLTAESALYADEQLRRFTDVEILTAIQEGEDLFSYEPTGEFSNVVKENYSNIYTESNMLLNSYYRTNSEIDLQAAVLAYAAGDPIPVEPLTGKPYLYDEKTNQLVMPNDPLVNGLEVKGVKLPEWAR